MTSLVRGHDSRCAVGCFLLIPMLGMVAYCLNCVGVEICCLAIPVDAILLVLTFRDLKRGKIVVGLNWESYLSRVATLLFAMAVFDFDFEDMTHELTMCVFLLPLLAYRSGWHAVRECRGLRWYTLVLASCLWAWLTCSASDNFSLSFWICYDSASVFFSIDTVVFPFSSFRPPKERQSPVWLVNQLFMHFLDCSFWLMCPKVHENSSVFLYGVIQCNATFVCVYAIWIWCVEKTDEYEEDV